MAKTSKVPVARAPNRTLTGLLLLSGAIAITFIPLYMTEWQDALYDGAFLLIAIAFLADSLFRCIDPANWKGNRNVFFILISFIMLVMALLQYGPIATDVHDERLALREALQTNSVQELAQFEKDRARRAYERPNGSLPLLLASVIMEYSVILFVEK